MAVFLDIPGMPFLIRSESSTVEKLNDFIKTQMLKEHIWTSFSVDGRYSWIVNWRAVGVVSVVSEPSPDDSRPVLMLDKDDSLPTL